MNMVRSSNTFIMEPCQSGLTYLFAKEAGALYPLEGSNPSGSANVFAKLKLCEGERLNCFSRVRDSEDFSVRAKRGGKVPGYVIAEKRTRGPSGSA